MRIIIKMRRLLLLKASQSQNSLPTPRSVPFYEERLHPGSYAREHPKDTQGDKLEV